MQIWLEVILAWSDLPSREAGVCDSSGVLVGRQSCSDLANEEDEKWGKK